MPGEFFDLASALFAIAAAVFWLMTARIAIPTGFDTDDDQASAFKRLSRMNGLGALAAAAAALIQVAKVYFT